MANSLDSDRRVIQACFERLIPPEARAAHQSGTSLYALFQSRVISQIEFSEPEEQYAVFGTFWRSFDEDSSESLFA